MVNLSCSRLFPTLTTPSAGMTLSLTWGQYTYVGPKRRVISSALDSSSFLKKSISWFAWPRTTQVSPGLQSYLKNFKTPFFWRYFEFLQLGNSNRSKNDPKQFFWKYLKNDGRYGHSKFWHSRWRCWFVGWDMTKIFLSI